MAHSCFCGGDGDGDCDNGGVVIGDQNVRSMSHRADRKRQEDHCLFFCVPSSWRTSALLGIVVDSRYSKNVKSYYSSAY